jgi:hypothetical protein
MLSVQKKRRLSTHRAHGSSSIVEHPLGRVVEVRVDSIARMGRSEVGSDVVHESGDVPRMKVDGLEGESMQFGSVKDVPALLFTTDEETREVK